MQKILSKVSSTLVAAMLLAPMLSVFAPQMAIALESDPILIESCDDLFDIANDANTLAAHYKLNNDIDCSVTEGLNINLSEWEDGDADNPLIPDSYTGVINNGYSGFDPIGSPMEPFTGTFDGNGNTISNLWIFRKDTSTVGLFASTNMATIQDLTLSNSSIVGGQNTGGLVGEASDTGISNIRIENGMTRAYLSYNGGGIAGMMYGNDDSEHPAYIASSTVSGGNVHGSGNIIGGLVGYMSGGSLLSSQASADIDGGYSIGGAIGEMQRGVVSGVTVGDITVNSDFSENQFVEGIAKSGNIAGGFVGYMNGGSISYSSTSADVQGEGSSIGGFAGEVQEFSEEDTLTISNSAALGDVVGNGNDTNDSGQVGGFVGSASGRGVEISNSFAAGDVSVNHVPDSATSYSAGGFAGSFDCEAIVSRSYATGSISALTTESVGGFAGGSSGCEGPGGVFERVYATGSVAGLNSVGGLLGQGGTIKIDKSYASGLVEGNNYVGGLVGFVSGTDWTAENTSRIEKSYASGSVIADGDGAGGLVGHIVGGLLSDVYARGNVTANSRVGGLIGEANQGLRIDSAYATGVLNATITDYLNGLIGDTIDVSGAAMFNPSYFDQQANGGVTTDENATPRNTNQMTTFANIVNYESDLEIGSWDFGEVWEFIAGQNDDYPLFTWQDDPIGQPLCEQAVMTSTTGTINCEMQYQGDVSEAEPEDWNITRYRKAGVTEWTNMEWVATSEGRRTFYNLEPDTTYELSVRVSNNVFDSFIIVEGTTLPADSDRDEDGVIDSDENEGPNRGDSNNDGTLDSLQESVTAFSSFISNKYVALESTCDSNFNVQIGRESDNNKDAGYDYPAGLLGFVLRDCGQNGATATITQYYYGDYNAASFVLRKANSETGLYITVTGAQITNEVIDGEPVIKVVYQITDGGQFDEDGIADGNIVDPVGLGVQSVGSPNTGLLRL